MLTNESIPVDGALVRIMVQEHRHIRAKEVALHENLVLQYTVDKPKFVAFVCLGSISLHECHSSVNTVCFHGNGAQYAPASIRNQRSEEHPMPLSATVGREVLLAVRIGEGLSV